jgi:hypothetical protein
MSTNRAYPRRLIVCGLIPGNFYIAVGPFSFNFTWFPLVRNRRQPPLGRSAVLNAEIKAGPSTAKDTAAARR